MSPGAANLFPFFSEENNPLYLDPSERAANEAQQGNRDTAKRTKREVLTLTLTLTLALTKRAASPTISPTHHTPRASPASAPLLPSSPPMPTGARRGDDLPHAALGLLVRALPLRVPHHLALTLTLTPTLTLILTPTLTLTLTPTLTLAPNPSP